MFKYDFSEPLCASCEHRKGDITKYCHGFPNRKNPRRFRASDPKYKAPKWCPKRLRASAVRIYRCKDSQSWLFAHESILLSRNEMYKYAAISEFRYTLAFEYHSGITAKAFYELSLTCNCNELYGFTLETCDVIEVDDGLKAYSFLYLGAGEYKPGHFDSAKIRGNSA